MDRLRREDLRRVAGFLAEGDEVTGIDDFVRHVIRALPRLVPCALIGYNDINPEAGRITWTADPDQATRFEGSEDALGRHVGTHPGVRHAAKHPDAGWFRISDFLTRTAFRKTPLYNEYYRRVGVEYQAMVLFRRSPSTFMGISMNRKDRDFSDRERAMLNIVWPRLRQAYTNAERFSRLERDVRLVCGGLDSLRIGPIALTPNTRIRFVTTAARAHLGTYFGGMPAHDELPAPIALWLAKRTSAGGRLDANPESRLRFSVECEGRRLTVQLVRYQGDDLLLLEDELTEVSAAQLRSLGLPPRQTEILRWVAQGKTNPEIATILDRSPRTVQHHLERIFQTLGVETRTAAAACALEAAKSVLAIP